MKRQHHHPFSSFFTCIVFDRSSEEKSIESKNYACVFTFIWIPKRKKGNRTHYLLIQYFFCVLVFWIFYVNFENYFPGQLVAKCCSRQYFSKLLQWIIFTHYCSEQFFAKFCKYLFQTIFLGKLLLWIIFLQTVVVSEWLASFEDYLSSHRYSKLFFWTIFCKLLLWTIFCISCKLCSG